MSVGQRLKFVCKLHHANQSTDVVFKRCLVCLRSQRHQQQQQDHPLIGGNTTLRELLSTSEEEGLAQNAMVRMCWGVAMETVTKILIG